MLDNKSESLAFEALTLCFMFGKILLLDDLHLAILTGGETK